MRESLRAITLTCVFALAGAACTSDRKVAQVGDFVITQSMVDDRERVAKIFYPQERQAVGLLQLVRFFTYAQILKNHGRPITEQALTQEEARIDQQTRDPGTLQKIKAVFGSRREEYRQIFILPTYVDRTFYSDFFLNSPVIQAKIKSKAEDFFRAAVAEPQSFLELARTRHLAVAEGTLSLESGLDWKPLRDEAGRPIAIPKAAHEGGPALIDQSARSPVQLDVEKKLQADRAEAMRAMAEHWLDHVIARTPVGKVFASLVDMNDYWGVVRYVKVIGKNGKDKKAKHVLHAVNFPKENFETWLEAEKKGIRIEMPKPTP